MNDIVLDFNNLEKSKVIADQLHLSTRIPAFEKLQAIQDEINRTCLPSVPKVIDIPVPEGFRVLQDLADQMQKMREVVFGACFLQIQEMINTMVPPIVSALEELRKTQITAITSTLQQLSKAIDSYALRTCIDAPNWHAFAQNDRFTDLAEAISTTTPQTILTDAQDALEAIAAGADETELSSYAEKMGTYVPLSISIEEAYATTASGEKASKKDFIIACIGILLEILTILFDLRPDPQLIALYEEVQKGNVIAAQQLEVEEERLRIESERYALEKERYGSESSSAQDLEQDILQFSDVGDDSQQSISIIVEDPENFHKDQSLSDSEDQLSDSVESNDNADQ